jgi:hypothetical protein
MKTVTTIQGVIMKKAIIILSLAVIAGCTHMKVTKLNDEGYFPTDTRGDVVKNTSIDLDKKKSLILVTAGDFVKGQTKNIGYFDEVIDLDELQTRIVKAGLSNKVPTVTAEDKISVHNAAKHYRPFLWLKFDIRGEEHDNRFAQFKLIDPRNLEEIFITEIHLDYFWKGVNDQATWYPLFNSIIDYIKANSKTYSKKS